MGRGAPGGKGQDGRRVQKGYAVRVDGHDRACRVVVEVSRPRVVGADRPGHGQRNGEKGQRTRQAGRTRRRAPLGRHRVASDEHADSPLFQLPYRSGEQDRNHPGQAASLRGVQNDVIHRCPEASPACAGGEGFVRSCGGLENRVRTGHVPPRGRRALTARPVRTPCLMRRASLQDNATSPASKEKEGRFLASARADLSATDPQRRA